LKGVPLFSAIAKPPSVQHWEGQGISLDWPESWRVDAERVMPSPLEPLLKPTILCELLHDQPYAQVLLMQWDPLPPVTLKGAFETTYHLLIVATESYWHVTETTTVVNGLLSISTGMSGRSMTSTFGSSQAGPTPVSPLRSSRVSSRSCIA
jgi:hypothetical protein